MKLAVIVIALHVLVPIDGRAQTWSPAEQEILDFTKSCWSLFAAKDFDTYEASCLHPDYTRWWSGALVPVDLDHDRRILREYFSRNSWVMWDVQPMRILVLDHSAVIRYQLLTYRMSDEGEESFQVIGESAFLARGEDGWRLLALHEHDVQ